MNEFVEMLLDCSISSAHTQFQCILYAVDCSPVRIRCVSAQVLVVVPVYQSGHSEMD